MHEAARFILGALLIAVLVTAGASVGGWWLAPARRTARALRRRLGRADAMAVSPETARGAAISVATGGLALVRFVGDGGLLYPLAAVRGVELMLDGEVKARAFRGEGRRALDRIDPAADGRVTLRLILDDPSDPAFEVDLWRPQDLPRPGWSPQAALRDARDLYARVEAALLRA